MVKPVAKKPLPTPIPEPEPPMSHPRELYFVRESAEHFYQGFHYDIYGPALYDTYERAMRNCSPGWFVVRAVVTAAWRKGSTSEQVPY